MCEVSISSFGINIVCVSEMPIFTTKAHVFHIDPDTKKKWLPLSTQAVGVSYYHDGARHLYRIISVDGTKVTTQLQQSRCIEAPVECEPCMVDNVHNCNIPIAVALRVTRKLTLTLTFC